jgi:acylpyruvate hydrolase
MRFASCRHQGSSFAAAIIGEDAVPLRGIDELGLLTPSALLAAPPLDRARRVPLAEVELRPAVPHPAKVVCVGLNYLDHVGETGRDIPQYPVLFAKWAQSLLGPYDDLLLPPESTQVDYEGELAVVIGTEGRRIAPERAIDHVAGFCVANDVTMRDYQYKTHQWLQGKAWERSSPLGPFLVTADEVGDPGELELRLTLNGEEMQAASTAQLMFDVPTLVSRISEFVSLEPGDVLLTGTPGGVGFRREPQVFIRPGDRAVVEIDRVGRIENEFFAEDPAAS